MGLVKEFKKFVVSGRAIEVAIGIVLGAAFSKVITSLVNDMIMPPLGLFLSGVDFKSLKLTLNPAAKDVPAVTLNYGQFVGTVIDFLIVTFSVFMVVKIMNRLKK